MSSSTSSSERAPFARALLAVLLGTGASLALVLGFAHANDASAETILDRPTEARAALPRILAVEEPLVMAFGSSMTEVAFSPRQFDREMGELGIEVKSFNFGFGGLNPYFQDYLSRRIRDAFVEAGRRLELVLVEFTPLQNTRARWEGALPIQDSYVAMLADARDVLDLVLEDPTRGIRVAEIKYLRNEISAEMVTWYFGSEWLGRGSPTSGLPPDEAAQETLAELGEELRLRFRADYPDYEDRAWSWAWQGGGTIPEERDASTIALFSDFYAANRNEPRMADDRLWRIDCCDVEELRFEEELIAGFVRTVRNFQEFAERVEVILLPRNHDWIRRPPEAEARLAAVLERIASETGVHVQSFEDATEITPEMFADTTHLARYFGDVAYTRLLVETYEPRLAD